MNAMVLKVEISIVLSALSGKICCNSNDVSTKSDALSYCLNLISVYFHRGGGDKYNNAQYIRNK